MIKDTLNVNCIELQYDIPFFNACYTQGVRCSNSDLVSSLSLSVLLIELGIQSKLLQWCSRSCVTWPPCPSNLICMTLLLATSQLPLAFKCLQHSEPFATWGPFDLLFPLPGIWALGLFKSQFNVLFSESSALILLFQTAFPSSTPHCVLIDRSTATFSPFVHSTPQSIFLFICLFFLLLLLCRLRKAGHPVILSSYCIKS